MTKIDLLAWAVMLNAIAILGSLIYQIIWARRRRAYSILMDRMWGQSYDRIADLKGRVDAIDAQAPILAAARREEFQMHCKLIADLDQRLRRSSM